jgi:hypothetical protein
MRLGTPAKEATVRWRGGSPKKDVAEDGKRRAFDQGVYSTCSPSNLLYLIIWTLLRGCISFTAG